jgi:very-short-patch-repair endonuclease
MWTHEPTGTPCADLRQAWVDAARGLALQHPWEPGREVERGQRGMFNTPSSRAFLRAVQMGDRLLARQGAAGTLESLTAYVHALPMSPGLALVRHSLSAVRAGTDSLPETHLRLAVVEAGFPEPEVNHMVVINGRRRYLDLSWPARRVALEYHGAQHFSDPIEVRRDVSRRGELQQQGWSIVECTASDLDGPRSLFARIAAALGW